MRVDLPNNPASPLQPGGLADSQPGTESVPYARRAPTNTERIVTSLTQWRVAAPVLAICVGLLTWSLVIRLPHGAQLLKVSARAQAIAAIPATKNTNAISAEQVASLREEAKNIASRLITQRKEILPLLTELEARARSLGWRAERSLKAAQAEPFGQTNLTLHPAVIRLSPTTEQTAGFYPRLLEWLNAVATLEEHAEVVSVHVHADGSGISSAEVKLHFFSAPAHAEIAAK